MENLFVVVITVVNLVITKENNLDNLVIQEVNVVKPINKLEIIDIIIFDKVNYSLGVHEPKES